MARMAAVSEPSAVFERVFKKGTSSQTLRYLGWRGAMPGSKNICFGGPRAHFELASVERSNGLLCQPS